MTTNTPLVQISGQIRQLPSGNKLGPVTGGTATGEVMTQDQFGANSSQMTPSGSPTFVAVTSTADSTIHGLTIGTGPGTANTNTALGLSVMATADPGVVNCTGVGHESLKALTTGGSDTGCGAESLHAVTTGSGNAAFGNDSFLSLTTGSFSSALGSGCLRNITTADGNSGVGYQAGRKQADGSTDLTTAANGVYIGARARGCNNSDSYAIVIGADAIGEANSGIVLGGTNNTAAHIFGTLTIGDGADATKKATFDASGISTGTTRTLSLPNFNGTLSTLAGTETLSNKTLVAPILGTPASGNVANLTGTASININGTVGATTPAAGTFTDLISSGNTTIGDASGDTLTLNAGAWTVPNTVTWTKTQQVGVGEEVVRWQISDSATFLRLIDNTTNIAEFAPAFDAKVEATFSSTAFAFNATMGVASTTNTALLMLYRYNTGSGNTDLAAATPGFELRNRATSGLQFTGGHNMLFLGGSTSPTVATATADIAAVCGFDRVNTRHAAAGNRVLAIQGERGSPVYVGDDAVDFGASTGYLTVNGTDITLTATTIALPQKISTYNAIATVSNGVPSELATVDLTAQTANIGATTLYAVPASGGGLYRVTALVVLTTAASVSSTLPNVQITYTDVHTGGTVTIDATPVLGAAGIGQTGALTGNTVGLTSGGVIPINAKLSTNIQYSTVNYASTIAGMAYAIHLKLEAL